jgi:Zn-dependent protease/predicted transcriptional regulator
MHWSVTIGRIGGTAIRLHITFILFLMWIGISDYHAEGFLSARSSVIFLLLLFACVVAHEFGHILMARHFGIKTPDVTLLPIGGVANMERIPEDPWQELPVALAGPLVNVAIAGVLMFFGKLAFADFASIDLATAPLVPRLALVNISLVAFNLVPAFPMDGGRVLRALLAMKLGPQRATEIAARLGQGFAFLFLALGLVYNPMLILIGLFIFVTGSAELQAGQAHRALDGLTVSDCMEQNVQILARDQTLSDAVDILLRSSQRSYPVVDAKGIPIGMLDRVDLPDILKSADATTLVSTVMRAPRILHATTKLEDAMKDMGQMRNAPEIVTDGQGHVIGMLTLQSIAEILLIRTLRPTWAVRKPKA